MLSHALSLSAVVPSGVLDMTADFAPLFVGMVVVLGFGVLSLVASIATYDTRKTQGQMEQETDVVTPLPKAA